MNLGSAAIATASEAATALSARLPRSPIDLSIKYSVPEIHSVPGIHDLTTELSQEERQRLEPALKWLAGETIRRDVRVVLRTYNREKDPFATATHLLSLSPAEHLTALIVSRGVDPAQILVAHEDYKPSTVDQGWELSGFNGGWIEPEYYLPSTATGTVREQAPGCG